VRRVSRRERAFLDEVFHGALAIEPIALGTSLGRRSWSPYAARISLARDLFVDRDPRADVRLDDPRAASIFAHEAVHVWQRQCGRAVTRQGAVLQAGYTLRLFDPYAYDTRERNAASLRTAFILGNIEQQGRMIEDFVYAERSGAETAHFEQLVAYLRTTRARTR
jgi:hypothetical protein